MNKFITFAFFAFCAVANSQVIPVGPGMPLNLYQSDLIASQIGGGASSAAAAAAAAASSSSAANNDLIAHRISSLNAWPLVSPLGTVGPMGPVTLPVAHQGGSSSSAAAAAAAAASSASNALNQWPALSPLSPINTWNPIVGAPLGVYGPGVVY